MSEHLNYERGRRFSGVRELLNQHARSIGQPIFRPAKRWYQPHRWFKADEALVPRKANGPSITCGGLQLPLDADLGHFLTLGSTGAGKSSFLNPFMMEVAKHIAIHGGQMLVYDIKGTLYPILVDSGADITLVDPFDVRGKFWNVSGDIKTRSDARQMAEVLVPAAADEKDPFWTNVTRNIAEEVLVSLEDHSPGRWTFTDFIHIMIDPVRIEAVLVRDPESESFWRTSIGDERTRQNVYAALRSRFQSYVPVAALWGRCKESFSLKEWLGGRGGILLVRNHADLSAALAPIHRLLFDLAARRTLALPDSRDRHIWWFLDEVRSLGKLEYLFDLANLSRSKGCHLVLAAQSVEGLHHVYGKEHGEEVLGQMKNKIYLRVSSQLTAEWIERQIGQVQYLVEQINHGSGWSDGKRNTSTSVSHSRRRESLVMASEILNMPPPRPGTYFSAIHDIPDVGLFVNSVSFEQVIEGQPKPRADVPQFVERPAKHQKLAPWTQRDLQRLKLANAADPEELFSGLEGEGSKDI